MNEKRIKCCICSKLKPATQFYRRNKDFPREKVCRLCVVNDEPIKKVLRVLTESPVDIKNLTSHTKLDKRLVTKCVRSLMLKNIIIQLNNGELSLVGSTVSNETKLLHKSFLIGNPIHHKLTKRLDKALI